MCIAPVGGFRIFTKCDAFWASHLLHRQEGLKALVVQIRLTKAVAIRLKLN